MHLKHPTQGDRGAISTVDEGVEQSLTNFSRSIPTIVRTGIAETGAVSPHDEGRPPPRAVYWQFLGATILLLSLSSCQEQPREHDSPSATNTAHKPSAARAKASSGPQMSTARLPPVPPPSPPPIPDGAPSPPPPPTASGTASVPERPSSGTASVPEPPWQPPLAFWDRDLTKRCVGSTICSQVLSQFNDESGVTRRINGGSVIMKTLGDGETEILAWQMDVSSGVDELGGNLERFTIAFPKTFSAHRDIMLAKDDVVLAVTKNYVAALVVSGDTTVRNATVSEEVMRRLEDDTPRWFVRVRPLRVEGDDIAELRKIGCKAIMTFNEAIRDCR